MTPSHERILHDELRKALDVLRTPSGHRSGAFTAVADLIHELCPNAAREHALRSQAGADVRGTFGT